MLTLQQKSNVSMTNEELEQRVENLEIAIKVIGWVISAIMAAMLMYVTI